MFTWIQILRGLAASMVVLHHYIASQVERGAEVGKWLLDLGGSGVDIFFVISGFIMMITQSGMQDQPSARRFLARRLVRIAPLYWVLTTAAFLLAMLASAAVNSEITPNQFMMSMLFLPYSETAINMDTSAHEAYVIPMAWTLTFEWLFYLVFALALALRLRPMVRLVFIFCCYLALVGGGMWFQPDSPLLQMVTSPLVFEFLLGCMVAMLYMQGVRINGWLAVLLTLAASAMLMNIFHDSATGRILLWGGSACVLIAAAALNPSAKTDQAILQPLVHVGDISYSLYLSHFFTLALFVRLQQRLQMLGDSFSVLTLAAFFLLTWIVAVACYQLVEEPARKFFVRRRTQMRMVKS